MATENLLQEFFNSKSDANQFLEASQQEQLEKDFGEFVANGRKDENEYQFCEHCGWAVEDCNCLPE